MASFARYVGIDYSGAETPTSPLTGIRAYVSVSGAPPTEVQPSSTGRWTRQGIAEWVIAQLREEDPTLIGIDHGFSFPRHYFDAHRLTRDWASFLEDFHAHWPTDVPSAWVRDIRNGAFGNGTTRWGEASWRRLVEVATGAKSVFHFDVQGSVAKSTHAGLPWLRHIRQQVGQRVHFWPFDGWEIPTGCSAVVEVYPRLWSQHYPREKRTEDQQDAFAVAAAMRDADSSGLLGEWLNPKLSDDERAVAAIEGWILGVTSTERVSKRAPRAEKLRKDIVVRPADTPDHSVAAPNQAEWLLHFRDAFRDARSKALRDAEAYSELLHVLERMGWFLSGEHRGLGAYAKALGAYADRSPLATIIPSQWRGHHTPFEVLYDQLRRARNSAFHEGAYARHLTGDAVMVAIILEDSLMIDSERVGDYLVRSPVCAATWQPLSFIRQSMLANSFSSLPVEVSTGAQHKWRIVRDSALAAFLRHGSSAERARRLGLTLGEAVKEGMELNEALVCGPEMSITDALSRCGSRPILVTGADQSQLLGIATPFDLL